MDPYDDKARTHRLVDTDVLASIAAVCDDVLPGLSDGPARTAIEEQRRSLDEPLVAAVSGRVSAGKSTLINALVGARLAHTQLEECTRVVTWFKHGPDPHVRVHPVDGSPYGISLTASGGVPETFDRPVEEIDHIEVVLDRPELQNLTILDTPGLEGSEDNEAVARAAVLGSADRKALGVAEALIYVMKGDARQDDWQFLKQFQAAMPGLSAANCVGVLNWIDWCWQRPGDDPWIDGNRLAASKTDDLRTVVASVVPVIARLGESISTRRLTADDFVTMRAVGRAMDTDPVTAKILYSSVRGFSGRPVEGVTLDAWERLGSLLTHYGRYVAIERARSGGTDEEILDELHAQSGLRTIDDQVLGHLSRHAVAIKAGGALDRLEQAAWLRAETPENRSRLALFRDQLADLSDAPVLRSLPLSRALRSLVGEEVALDEARLEELRRLALGRTPAERLGMEEDASTEDLIARARTLEVTWQAEKGSVSLKVDAIAQAVVIGYAQVREDLSVGVR